MGSPEFWGTLSPEYASCNGRNQSPINIEKTVRAELSPIEFKYTPGAYELVNNGHTLQVNFRQGSTIKIEGEEFALKQFHLHAPSENKIKGATFPMEAHLVHANSAGDLAVIGVMFKIGDANPTLEKAWDELPLLKGQTASIAGHFSANGLLPRSGEYYRFNGSLTTPPCSEGVRWFVMKESMTASHDQIEMFSAALGGHHNNRPVQPLNARLVLE